jgi:hypothetical protein
LIIWRSSSGGGFARPIAKSSRTIDMSGKWRSVLPSKMDSAQEQRERRAGELLIEWYNDRHGTSFRFVGRPGVAPDLSYQDGNRQLWVEVVTAYYDAGGDAKFYWGNVRNHPDAPQKWKGENFERYLVNDISEKIVGKCAKSYGPHCLLAVHVYLTLTHAEDMEPLVKDIVVPATQVFEGIYLCADCAPLIDAFFTGGKIPDSRVWQLYPNT